MLTFQDLILKLHSFWASKGCLIWQPYNQVVGAGTMNPATFLRVLGPEPWNVAYTEPSARPDDGRFGQNPNRLYTHTQYQVILKPSPAHSQDLYLESLAAIGIDYRKHDIRFVEDNWAQPAIGAWGLGWEVWLDGLEITQYTYFQQVGGVSLDPVALELTYGLERIAMFLQGVDTVFDLKWDHIRTYGDVKYQDEVERSTYAFNFADVEELHSLFDIYEKEGRRAAVAGLVVPAHDYVLSMSNAFNLLDTRGAIGVTERARFLGRVRDLAQQVALAYVAQRETLGHPWLAGAVDKVDKVDPVPNVKNITNLKNLTNPAPLLFEIGVEELPADDVPKAQEQLGKLMEAELKAARLAHGAIKLFATPRRLAVLVADVAPTQRALDELLKGPGAKVAFDASGNPTQAAIGFAKRSGVEVADLVVKEEGGASAASYVYAPKREAGKPAAEVLAQLLPSLISKISFEKTMRWNETGVSFSRPLAWYVALLGDQVIEFEYAGVHSGKTSVGPRGEDSPTFEIDTPQDYQAQMLRHNVIADIAARRAEIVRQIEAAAASIGGTVVHDEGLLDEVTNLVEEPTAILGTFDINSLSVPAPVLMTVMRKHQRYFSLLDSNGKLLNHFIAVRNGPNTDTALVCEGNEGVLRARFADANYFFKQDIQQPLESYVPKLSLLTFQTKLGSMLDKTRRLEQLVEPVAALLKETGDGQTVLRPPSPVSVLDTAKKIAHLAKADLVTSMVVDFTSLQGVMGREYYKLQGGDAAVADGIAEHYLPRYAGDAVPKTLPGLIVSLADKLDSIAGLFAVGLAPKGNADPFALRRTAIGAVQALIDNAQSFSLRQGLMAAMHLQPVKWSMDALNAAQTFIIERARVLLQERGIRYDVADAVISAVGDDPYTARLYAMQLGAAVQRAEWPDVLAAYARCARIIKSQKPDVTAVMDTYVQNGADPEPAAQALTEAVQTLAQPHDAESLIANLQTLSAPIQNFFDKVMVMSEDVGLRNARLALLLQIVRQANGIADLSKIEGF